jgi:hypothetical protein
MNNACRNAFLRLWEIKGSPSQGKVFRHAMWGRIFTKLFRRLGWNNSALPREQRAVLYTFRHTWCSHLVMKGYSGKPLLAAMGWKTLSELSTYAHLEPNFLATMSNTVSCEYMSSGEKLLEEIKGDRV